MTDAPGKKPSKAKKKRPDKGRQEINAEVASMLTEWIGTYPRLHPAFEHVLQMSAKHGSGSQEVSDAWERFNRIYERESKRETPAAIEMPLTSDSDPRASMPERTSRHAGDITGMVYDDLVRQCAGSKIGRDHGVFHEIASTTVLHARDALQRTNAADPMEEMLVGQALLTHARVLRLNHLVARATEMNQVKVLCEAADRASNTYRRQMAAFDEYRRPRPTPHFNQTNIAGQQIIQNNVGDEEKPTNKQGLADDNPPQRSPSRLATLPTDAGGPTITTAGSKEKPAVEALHRHQDRRWESPVESKRAETR